MKKLAYIFGAFMFLIPAIAGAQALPFTAVDYDAKSLSKAGADLVQSTPAAIPYSDAKLDAAVGYTMWQPSAAGANIINLDAAYKMGDKFGLSLDFMYGMKPKYTITNSGGTASGQFAPSDIHAELGFGWKFLPFLSLGAEVGYATSSVAKDYSYGAVTADVFFMAKFGALKAAAGVSNLGTAVTSKSGAKYSLPSAASVGVGYDMSFAEVHGLGVTFDADYYFAYGFAAALAAEYSYADLAFVRAGFNYGGEAVLPTFASLGAGVKFAGLELNLAYLLGFSSPFSTAAKNTLSIGLGYSF